MRRFATGAVLLLCCLAPAAAAAPGDLDHSFARGGLLRADLGGTDVPTAMIAQDDGRVLVAGHSDVDPPSDPHYPPVRLDLGLARFTTAGRPDPTFGGGDGRVILDLGGQELVSALAVQSDGKILVGGQSHRAPRADAFHLALARIGPDGAPDTSFGNGGWAAVGGGNGNATTIRLVRVLADGRIAVVGSSGVAGTETAELVFARLLPDGRPDESLAPSGVRIVPFNAGQGAPWLFQLDSRGGALVAGADRPPYLDAPRAIVVERFSLDGVRDSGFGVGGAAVIGRTSRLPTAMALQSDGNVVVAMEVDPYRLKGDLVRLSPTGALDAGYGSAGRVRTIQPSSLAVDGADRVVVSGPNFHVARHERDGARDRDFVAPRIPPAYHTTLGTAVAATRDGDIVSAGAILARPLVGFERAEHDVGVVRFHGGDDARAPVIRIRGAPRHRCLRRAFRARIALSDASGIAAVAARLDGRRIRGVRARRRFSIRVPVQRLGSGRHELEIAARDAVENRARASARFGAAAESVGSGVHATVTSDRLSSITLCSSAVPSSSRRWTVRRVGTTRPEKSRWSSQ